MGGNSRLHSYFNFYGLNSESINKRYYSKAAEFYRMKLKELTDQGISNDKGEVDFLKFEDKPTYEEGREIVISAQRVSCDERGSFVL